MANTTNYLFEKPVRGTQNYDVPINSNFDKIDTEIKNRQNEIGNLANLETTDKTNTVNATNEIVHRIGVLSQLPTIDKSNIVNSIKEIDTQLADIASNVHNNELQTKINNAGEYTTLNIADTIIVSSPITLKNGLKITGKGTIQFGTPEVPITDAYLIDLTGLHDIEIERINIVVYGDSKGTLAQGLFKIDNCQDIKIKKNKITSINRSIFAITGKDTTLSRNIDIRKNKLSTSGTTDTTNVFIIYSANRTDVDTIMTKGNKNMKIFNNDCINSHLGFLLDCDESSISFNYFNNVDAPIACLKVKNTKFVSNTIKGFSSNGLCLGNGTDDIIESCSVLNNILDGYNEEGVQTSLVNGINIYAQGGESYTGNEANFPNRGKSRKITITGNVIRGCAANGIFAYANGNMTITGNVTTDNGGNGVSVSAKSGTDNINVGRVTVSSNFCKDNGQTGITIGDSTISSISNITCIGNTCVENGRGMYIAKVIKSAFVANIISKNKGCGLLLSGVSNSNFENNRVEDNLTNTTDSEGYNGNVALSLATGNNIKFDNNIVSSTSTYYVIATYFPTYRKGNQGFPNEQGMFIERNFEATGTTQMITKNVPLPNTSQWLSGQLLVQVSAARNGSSNIYATHQNCLAIINVVRLGSTITIGEIKYIHQNQATDPNNGNAAVPQATISAVVNADNNSIDITANSNYSSTNMIVMTVSPLRSALFQNYNY